MRIFLAVAMIVNYVFGSQPDADAAGSSEQRPVPRRPYALNPLLRQRDEIVRSVVIAHPKWSAAQAYAEVAPKLSAAGISPISIDFLGQQLSNIRKELRLPPRRRHTLPEHAAFLKAQFEENHKQKASEVIAKFQAQFGPKAWKSASVASWWYSALRYMYYKPVSGPTRGTTPQSRDPSVSRTTPSPPTYLGDIEEIELE